MIWILAYAVGSLAVLAWIVHFVVKDAIKYYEKYQASYFDTQQFSEDVKMLLVAIITWPILFSIKGCSKLVDAIGKQLRKKADDFVKYSIKRRIDRKKAATV